jgi:glycosyltransferase involved in cell wall biosynthesis
MRICLVTRNIPGTGFPAAGGEVSSYYLAKRLASVGHEVFVVTRLPISQKPRATKNGSLTVFYFLSDPKIPIKPSIHTVLNWASNIPQLTSIIEQIKPDIIHSYSIDMISRIRIATSDLKIPTIATINNHFLTCPFLHIDPDGDICIKCTPTNLTKCLAKRMPARFAVAEKIMQLIRKNFAWEYDHYTVLSQSHKSILIQHRFPASKITVIPNFIDIQEFQARAKKYAHEIEQNLILPKTKPIVTYIGYLREQKGVKYLIQAIPQILREHSNAYFLIVGPGPQRNELIQLATKMGVAEKTLFIEYIDPEKIPAVYYKSTLIVFPSIWPEPLGRIHLEAYAVEKPVVATNVGGIPEIVQNNVNGLLVPPKDSTKLAEAINTLLADPETCRIMGVEGRKYIETNNSPQRVLNQFLTIYQQVAQTARKPQIRDK